VQGTAQRFALPALGRGRRSRPTGKMLRRVKLLGMCAESPASGARFVRFCGLRKIHRLKTKAQFCCDLILHAPQFFTSLTLPTKTNSNLQNTKADDLPKPLLKTDFTKKRPCQKK